MPRKKRDTSVDEELIHSLKDLPETLGECADELYSVREKRLALERKADGLKAREAALKDHLINNLPKSEADGITGRKAIATITKKTIPRVEDWDKFYAHIKKTGNFEFLQRRVNESAVKERWENKKEVPGVGTFMAVTVSVRKA